MSTNDAAIDIAIRFLDLFGGDADDAIHTARAANLGADVIAAIEELAA